MTKFASGEIAQITGGQVIWGPVDAQSAGISTDTRTIEPGQLFVALKGDRFDGHHYLKQALNRGAAGLLINRGAVEEALALEALESARDQGEPGFAVAVNDTLYALGDLAAHHRQQHPIPLIAITGSCGKTTTRELISAALATACHPVLATMGNLNNRIGLPLTLFNLEGHHRAAVLELGMNEPGEIGRLTAICAPTVAVVTNVFAAHTEGLGSIKGVAEAKGELFRTMGPDTTVILNLDDREVVDQYERSGHRGPVVTYGRQAQAQVRIITPDPAPPAQEKSTARPGTGARTRGTLSVQGVDYQFCLSLLGSHNVPNAACAVACCLAMGITPRTAITAMESVETLGRRLALKSTGRGVTILDDTYNANGASMEAAMDVLGQLTGKHGESKKGLALAVLGDMLELGSQGEEIHRAAGAHAARINPDFLFTVGPLASTYLADQARIGGMTGKIETFETPAAATDRLLSILGPGDTVLVKASRGMRLDLVVDGLMEAGPPLNTGKGISPEKVTDSTK